jgi:hypothetical protein
MKKILSILLVFVMIGLVAVSGCTDTADEGTEDEAIVGDETVIDETTDDEDASGDAINETVADANETSGEDVIASEEEVASADENENPVEDGNATVSE